jgi:hypothetical protein
MTRLVLAASLLACEAARTAAAAAPPSVPPLRLAIYYGYPSLVEDARGDAARVAAVFGEYDVIVFGDGLEGAPDAAGDAGLRAERERMGPIIRALHATARHPRIYGYIDLGSSQNLPLAEIERRIDAWRQLGADGIFFDEAGSEFAVTPARRRAAVRAVHTRQLSAFMNAFVTDDLFQGDDNADLDPAGRLGQDDAVLIESFGVRNGEPEPAPRIAARAASALRWRDRSGARVLAVTTASRHAFEAGLFAYAWWSAAVWGLDGIGWGEPDFSANSRLPWRARPREEATLAGSRLTAPPIVSAAGVRRSTSAGTIVVDAAARRGWLER